ncbi:transcriptional regulator [Comamonas sp. lk]|uniref:transcriptional regulator n=1 Tax=Comamonas sp. lk TaxID=2201272 RepID=UPI000EAD2B9C|nr:transcriptional regulator [Comamonas sp. lk]
MPIVINGQPHEDGRFPLPLTDGPPHILRTSPGQGSLDIGPKDRCPKADLWVDAHQLLRWSCFDAFATPAGSPWPRHIRYTGSDHGFFAWSAGRPIENFSWWPPLSGELQVDARASRIQTLAIYLPAQGGGHLTLHLPDGENAPPLQLSLQGDLSKITVKGEAPGHLSLSPLTSKRSSDAPLQLPELGLLQQTSSLELRNGAGKQPICLHGLKQFPHLSSLALWGQCAHLESLGSLTELTALQLRFMPQLGGLPALDSWPRLEHFIAYNVEEAEGKRLRQQLKAREKLRPWQDYSAVSQLRKPEWWRKEYGRPFSGWPAARAKLAHTAYDLAAKGLGQAQDLEQAQAALRLFTARFNSVKGMETGEREDLGEAVWQLAQLPQAQALGLSAELAQQCFDEARDY